MDLKVSVVIVCLCILAITSTEAAIPKCCVKITKKINKNMMMNVMRWYEQQSTGACDIPALIVYRTGSKRPICAPLKLKPFLEKHWGKMKQNPLPSVISNPTETNGYR
ncbi:C-C motif chemokine 27a [Lates japonicus]|uniref:C-C motif chemokine 27a n=1 Tax=Lates japonicus TaxID=270547 RepID=A0AAD3MJ70_LATJO|nr:C-C motif chemokine 27a [Lates japonicus]